jgi:hypothetical protein
MLKLFLHRTFAVAVFVSVLAGGLSSKARADSPMKAETFWQSIEARLSPPIYATSFDEAESLNDWQIEGPALVRIATGKLHYGSQRPQADHPEHGHSVLWFPVELPEAYVIEWTFRPVSEHGLGILFFDAVPIDPEVDNIFVPAMPPRDGSFEQYVKGAIRSYHVSYFAHTPFNPDRGKTHLRGNPGLKMLATGPDAVPVVPIEQRKSVRLRLIRETDRVTLLADDRLILSHPLPRPEDKSQSARAGFRQMQWTRAEYGSLSIRVLRSEKLP